MNPIKLFFLTSIIPALTYKKGALVIWSIPFSVLIEMIYTGSFLGINLTFTVLFMVLIFFDFITGLVASKFAGEKIQSTKIAFTFYKVLMYLLFFWLVFEINKSILESDSFLSEQGQHSINFIRNFVFTILVLREYISIGENIEKRFGKKPYIFTLVEKISDIIENKLIRKIEDSELCNTKDKDKDETK